MSNNLITKEALADALTSLLKEMPLSKISVKNITSYCNISRNTFYYHFKDKYELIHWIFYTDMLEHVDSLHNPRKLTENFINVCKCLYANRKFYLSCFQYAGQNSLYEYLFNFYYELWKININIHDQECHFQLTEGEVCLLAKLRTHALVGIISDWVKDGMHDNYMIYFEQLRNISEFERAGCTMLSDEILLQGKDV